MANIYVKRAAQPFGVTISAVPYQIQRWLYEKEEFLFTIRGNPMLVLGDKEDRAKRRLNNFDHRVSCIEGKDKPTQKATERQLTTSLPAT